jgi:molybdate transport system ATP-binding protein
MKMIGNGHIKVDRVDFSLDVKIAIPQQGVLGLFGPSGCGKTSILRALAGLEYLSKSHFNMQGTVWQDGAQTFVPPERRNIGYVFQESLLFPHLTVQQNLDYVIRRRSTNNNADFTMDSQTIIELLGLTRLLKQRPHQLSGGEQQRVAIARALLRHPQLMLFDEPLASLDQQRKNEVLPFLIKLHKELNIPMIYVSHSIEEVMMICDYIMCIENGRSVFSGQLFEAMTSVESPVSKDAKVSSVFDGLVMSSETSYGLSKIVTSQGNEFWVKGAYELKEKVRVVIPANEVSVSLNPLPDCSILNDYCGEITRIQSIDSGEQLMTVCINGDDFISRISGYSMKNLGLSEGKKVWIHFKSQSVRVFS